MPTYWPLHGPVTMKLLEALRAEDRGCGLAEENIGGIVGERVG